MIAQYYLLIITLTTVSFTLIDILSKLLFNSKGKSISFKSFLPLYLSLSSVFAVSTTLFLTQNLYIQYPQILYTVLMGLIYTVAAYIFFFSIEYEKVSLIGVVTGSQFIILSFISAILFVHSEVFIDSIISAIMLIGVVLMSITDLKNLKISIYVFLALIANLLWVLMWLIFYSSIASGLSPLIYYSWLTIFSALFSIIFSVFLGVKYKSITGYFDSFRTITVMTLTGLFNGFGTVMFSLAYIINSVYSPLISELSLPSLILLSFIFLKERLKLTQIIGVMMVITSVFLLFFIS